ncbi:MULTISPECIES: transposase [unclassified Rhizobium]|jgi:putative transposase|uniref:transposase n=1 Tax=unclassified Rhizobium TaxID=2613769 RepID=UPI000648EE9A|nr:MULTISPECIES: transposase [unclassified Rhizobium]MBN8951452.1 transposase [Rhizobium tropici]OJY74736.1 MAG: transposase [Rhizobium sp. 60-20]RKD66756.1 putative transposase [Rhizobium sp. WW_1]
MARLARIVIHDTPHHVTQRGNGRAQTFFCDDDYALYRDLLAHHCRAAGVEVWGWVLMPNHVHLILIPADADGIRRALSRVHRTYAGHIHARLRRTGHFWQGRFDCVAMDEEHLATALRYVALNPVRARLVERAADWRWSSVAAQLGLIEDDGVTTTTPVRTRFPDFAALLTATEEEMAFATLRRAESIGRPIGNTDFFDRLEDLTNTTLKPARRGRKAKAVIGE